MGWIGWVVEYWSVCGVLRLVRGFAVDVDSEVVRVCREFMIVRESGDGYGVGEVSGQGGVQMAWLGESQGTKA